MKLSYDKKKLAFKIQETTCAGLTYFVCIDILEYKCYIFY